jgi:hypothetical protein
VAAEARRSAVRARPLAAARRDDSASRRRGAIFRVCYMCVCVYVCVCVME